MKTTNLENAERHPLAASRESISGARSAAESAIRLRATVEKFSITPSSSLDAIFQPKSIAVIGATENLRSVGGALMHNLDPLAFNGAIYPVNPKRKSVFGLAAYPTIGAVPGKVDLAIIATPSASVPGVIRECAQAGIKGAVIISAGFRECGPEGMALEQEILKDSRHSGIRLVGPNCLGVMRPHSGLNATFAASIAQPGSVAFLSQSGALCTAVLGWSFRENVGFSAFVSIGSMLDVDWGDLISYFGDDPYTKSIVCYMESVGDARRFLSAAREVSLTKPIIVIKVGRTAEAARAAASHTGSLTGSDDVLDAAFKRVGVLRVQTIEELFDMAEVLGKLPRPRGPRLAIITNAGGPAALATDMLVRSGGKLSELSAGTVSKLNEFLPPHWSHNNPIDIIGDASADRYAKTLEVVSQDPGADGLLVVLTPQAMTDATATAEQIKDIGKEGHLPLLASWMGGAEVDAGKGVLNAANVPTFAHPDAAARAFSDMWRYTDGLRSLYETPLAIDRSHESLEVQAKCGALLRSIRESGRTLVSRSESQAILSAYGIPSVDALTATTEDDACERAQEIGFPVVVKLLSHTLTHKTEVGGVKLDLKRTEEVRQAWRSIRKTVEERCGLNAFDGVTVEPMIKGDGYELILGSSIDPQFGPVLLFGTGGTLVEVFKDRALGLPPLNATLARRLMEETRIYEALKGVRGRKAVDLAKLEQILVRFSQLVVQQPAIKEIDLNPLIASAEHLVAADVRIILWEQAVDEADFPKPAIKPYPLQYQSECRLLNGSSVTLRPIRPEDEPLMVEFHKQLSESSVYMRYFSYFKLDQRIGHERLSRNCFIDYEREIALVAVRRDSTHGKDELMGVARLIKAREGNAGEFAIVIADAYQGQGLGTALLHQLVRIGREEQLARITGDVLADNPRMLRVCRKAGFRTLESIDKSLVKVELAY